MSEEIKTIVPKKITASEMLIKIDEHLKAKLDENDYERSTAFMINQLENMVISTEEKYGSVDGVVVFLIFEERSDHTNNRSGLNYAIVFENDQVAISNIISDFEGNNDFNYSDLEDIKKLLVVHWLIN